MISEAVTIGVPIVSSAISGSIGLLGEDYGGYFPVGDTQALAFLLERAENDAAFYEVLRAQAPGAGRSLSRRASVTPGVSCLANCGELPEASVLISLREMSTIRRELP